MPGHPEFLTRAAEADENQSGAAGIHPCNRLCVKIRPLREQGRAVPADDIQLRVSHGESAAQVFELVRHAAVEIDGQARAFRLRDQPGRQVRPGHPLAFGVSFQGKHPFYRHAVRCDQRRTVEGGGEIRIGFGEGERMGSGNADIGRFR